MLLYRVLIESTTKTRLSVAFDLFDGLFHVCTIVRLLCFINSIESSSPSTQATGYRITSISKLINEMLKMCPCH